MVGLNLAPLPENTSSLDDACDVAVMGGGFGGLYTALAISRQAKKYNRNVDIVLVDNRDRFVFFASALRPYDGNCIRGRSMSYLR